MASLTCGESWWTTPFRCGGREVPFAGKPLAALQRSPQSGNSDAAPCGCRPESIPDPIISGQAGQFNRFNKNIGRCIEGPAAARKQHVAQTAGAKVVSPGAPGSLSRFRPADRSARALSTEEVRAMTNVVRDEPRLPSRLSSPSKNIAGAAAAAVECRKAPPLLDGVESFNALSAPEEPSPTEPYMNKPAPPPAPFLDPSLRRCVASSGKCQQMTPHKKVLFQTNPFGSRNRQKQVCPLFGRPPASEPKAPLGGPRNVDVRPPLGAGKPATLRQQRPSSIGTLTRLRRETVAPGGATAWHRAPGTLTRLRRESVAPRAADPDRAPTIIGGCSSGCRRARGTSIIHADAMRGEESLGHL